MANMKGGHTQSYRTIRKVFVGTDYGTVTLELAVGEANVLTVTSQGIIDKIPRKDVRDADLPLVNACRELDEKEFSKFCDSVENF